MCSADVASGTAEGSDKHRRRKRQNVTIELTNGQISTNAFNGRVHVELLLRPDWLAYAAVNASETTYFTGVVPDDVIAVTINKTDIPIVAKHLAVNAEPGSPLTLRVASSDEGVATLGCADQMPVATLACR